MCEIFLMPDRVVVVHDEPAHHHSFRTDTFDAFLDGRLLDERLLDEAEKAREGDIQSRVEAMRTK